MVWPQGDKMRPGLPPSWRVFITRYRSAMRGRSAAPGALITPRCRRMQSQSWGASSPQFAPTASARRTCARREFETSRIVVDREYDDDSTVWQGRARRRSALSSIGRNARFVVTGRTAATVWASRFASSDGRLQSPSRIEVGVARLGGTTVV